MKGRIYLKIKRMMMQIKIMNYFSLFILNFKPYIKYKFGMHFNCDIPKDIRRRCIPDYKRNIKKSTDIHIWHPFGIIINKHVKIGNNCILAGNNVIGNNGGYPTIGDNVFIGIGAIILGDISIGSNVKVAAGAVITKTIPDNVTVVEYNKIIYKCENDK